MDMEKAHRVLVLGGVRSGKSELAERLVRSWDRGEVTYLATGEARDEEMALRIQRHRQRRPATWRTWEGDPEDLPGAVRPLGGVLLLDCLTLWLSRLLLRTPAAVGDHDVVVSCLPEVEVTSIGVASAFADEAASAFECVGI